MENIIFRAAKIEDVAQLVDLRFMMIAETRGIDENQRTSEFEKEVRDYFDKNLATHFYFGAVAEHGGRLIASTGLVLYKKPPSFKGATGIVGYVTNVYTIPEFRKRGIASELMNLLIAHAKQIGADKIHLGTTDKGRNMYEKIGFKEVAFPALELRF